MSRFPEDVSDSGFTAVTLGNFDGVHLGHQAIIKRMKERVQEERSARLVLVSFYPHPAQVLGKTPGPIPAITSLREKSLILGKLGVDLIYLVHFTLELSKWPYQRFVEEVLIEKLGVNYLAVGADARIGRGGEGTVERIRELLEPAGVEFEVVADRELAGKKISSRQVRALIVNGEVAEARQLLGRNVSITRRVVHGDKRGRQLGYRTANLRPGEQVCPGSGVYISQVRKGDELFLATTNIGTRPTFDCKELVIESHLLDYDGEDFYGSLVTVNLIERIRDELKFDSIDDLVKRIEEDNQIARAWASNRAK